MFLCIFFLEDYEAENWNWINFNINCVSDKIGLSLFWLFKNVNESKTFVFGVIFLN